MLMLMAVQGVSQRFGRSGGDSWRRRPTFDGRPYVGRVLRIVRSNMKVFVCVGAFTLLWHLIIAGCNISEKKMWSWFWNAIHIHSLEHISRTQVSEIQALSWKDPDWIIVLSMNVYESRDISGTHCSFDRCPMMVGCIADRWQLGNSRRSATVATQRRLWQLIQRQLYVELKHISSESTRLCGRIPRKRVATTIQFHREFCVLLFDSTSCVCYEYLHI